MSFCFLVTVKVDNPDQEFYVKRCLEGIRQFYPNTLVVLVTSKGTTLTTVQPDAVTHIVENPFYAIYGAIALFHTHRYADYAYVLHDSMAVVHPLPEPTGDVRFLYSFDSSHYEHNHYSEAYKVLLPLDLIEDMVRTLPMACFGCACLIRYDAIKRMNLLELIPKVSSKYMLEAMERVFAYLAFKHRLVTDPLTICGDIFNPSVCPWYNAHLERATLSQLHNFPQPIVKSLVCRL